MDLNQAFGNVAHACNGCLLSKEQRIVVEESLGILVRELNNFDALKKQIKAASAEKPEKKEVVPLKTAKMYLTEDGIKKAAVAHCKGKTKKKDAQKNE